MYEIPLTILFYMLAGLFAGMYADKFFRTNSPFFTITLISFGLIYGIWIAVRKLTR